MNSRWLITMGLMAAVMGVFEAPAANKFESTGACSSAEVSDEIKGILQEQGVRVFGDKGPMCDIWLRKTLPLKAGSTTPEYGSLNTGELIGVAIYSGSAGDFRGQELKPGTYTIRYQTMPSDGNHMGVSPTQDYVLLCPAALDKDPAKDVEYEALVNMSRKASGTNHPAPLYLVAPTSGGTTAFRDAGDGHWALELKTKAQASGTAAIDFPLAIVLIGKGEGG